MRRIIPIMGMAFSLAFALSVHPALGITIRVPADQPTIQAGIDAAADGYLVLVAPGTYVENIDFKGKAIALRSEQGVDVTVIDGDRDGSGATFQTGETEGTIIEGFTIRNGSGRLDPLDHHSGGGIYCYGASPTIRDCLITGNETYKGGGIYLFDSGALIEDCSIIGNVGRGYGGGIRCRESTPTIRHCTIRENRTNSDGGGISISLSDPMIMNCEITKNRADFEGGGILLWYSDPVIEDSRISGNSAGGHGGGIKGYGSSPLISNCDVSENSAANNGGGIYFFSFCYPTIENCTISRNNAFSTSFPNGGGGLCLEGTSDATVTNCEITENSAHEYGGGIMIGNSSPTFTNCIVSGNSTGDVGGGFSCDGYFNSMVIINCTITGNSAASSGGGIRCRDYLSLTVTNGILWGNTAPEGPEITLTENSGVAVGYSDVQGGEAAVFIEPGSALNWLEGNIDEDPLFDGATAPYLSTGSPCIDAGDPAPESDDECFPPSMGAERSDLGAFGGPGACSWCGDRDGDGFSSDVCEGEDCDDTEVDTHPGAEEVCDGRDNDCDGILPSGEADGDGDGWMPCEGECDDADPDINPGVDEICAGGIDEDCDGLVDMDDPDCIVEFSIDLTVTYGPHSGGALILDFTMGAPEPSLWATWLILTSPAVQVLPLWTVPIPAIDPPQYIFIPIQPFPSMGWVGVYMGLITAEGIQAADFGFVDTG